MPAGLSFGTRITSRFLTKISGSPSTRPSFVAVSISSSEAEAKTSAGAPCWIWVSRVELDSKLCFISTPEFCSSNVFASSPKASVSEEPATTVSVPPPPSSPPPPSPSPALPPPPPPHDTRSSTINRTHASAADLDRIEPTLNHLVFRILHDAPDLRGASFHIRERRDHGLCATCTDFWPKQRASTSSVSVWVPRCHVHLWRVLLHPEHRPGRGRGAGPASGQRLLWPGWATTVERSGP